MEVAGLAIGVAGLAGLFSACSTAFQLVQRGRSFGKDYKILETKFTNQELRLRAWGRACGLIDGTQYDTRLDDPELNQQLRASLECIQSLLSDAQKLKDRYGLNAYEPTPSESSVNKSRLSLIASDIDLSGGVQRRSSLRSLVFRKSGVFKERPKSAISTATWVIEDRERFQELVRDLKDLIDDLETLTKATRIPQRQSIFIEYEVESIDDVETLEEMEQAREGDDDIVSDAASVRLSQISYGTASLRTSLEVTSFKSVNSFDGSFISLESYFTARSQFSRTSSIAEAENAILIPVVRTQTPSYPLIELDIRPRYKCVVVGESGSRKTDVLLSFIRQPHGTVFEECVSAFWIDGHMTSLELWDVSGLEAYNNLLYSSFALTNVFIICFRLPSLPVSQDYELELEAELNNWAQEVRHRSSAPALILAGVEEDWQHEQTSEESERGQSLAKELGALAYIQCNIITRDGIDELFHTATRAAIHPAGLRLFRPPRRQRFSLLPWRNSRTKMKTITETKDESEIH